uniref:Uncharacterized protein n=1 Tax=viral metagenome TaxID=1070528 RepID=A0A6C0BIM9_9ZZZZ
MEAATYYHESAAFASVDAGKALFVYVASFGLAVVVAIRAALVEGNVCEFGGGILSLKSWSVARAVVFSLTVAGWLASIQQALRAHQQGYHMNLRPANISNRH